DQGGFGVDRLQARVGGESPDDPDDRDRVMVEPAVAPAQDAGEGAGDRYAGVGLDGRVPTRGPGMVLEENPGPDAQRGGRLALVEILQSELGRVLLQAADAQGGDAAE